METPAVPEPVAPAPVPVIEPAAPLLGGLPFGEPAALQAELERYGLVRQVFVDWLLSNLTPGADFMLIHRSLGRGQTRTSCTNKQDTKNPRCDTCGGKATLCKPGAEKICGLLQLRPRFRRDAETWEMLGSEPGVVALVCELVTVNDVVVAEGRGARHRDLDGGDVNKTIKMCQKSAQIDAVLRCAGLSELFSQDLEDMSPTQMESDDASQFGAVPRKSAPAAEKPAPAAAAPPPPPPPAAPDTPKDQPPGDAISVARVRRIYALLHEELRANDVGDDMVGEVFETARDLLKAWVKETQGRAHLEHASWREYDALCAQIPRAVTAALSGGGRRKPAERRVRYA